MKKLVMSFVWLITAIVVMGQQAHWNDPSVVADFDRSIEMAMKKKFIPAVSVAVIENGVVVYSNEYGIKAKDGDKASTQFEICSLSKIYMLAAAMQMLQADSLDLFQPIWEVLEHPRLAHDERYKKITADMLLSHTSGIENWQNMYDPNKLEIMSEPGTSYEYSGEGYNYLADAFEVMMERPYEAYIHDLVLDPLNISSNFSFYVHTTHATVHYPVGHNLMGERVPSESHVVYPSSTVCTDAHSFAVLLMSFFNDEYITQASRDYLFQEKQNLGELGDLSVHATNGFFKIKDDDQQLLGFFGSNSGFKSMFSYSLTSGNGYVYFTNSDWGDLFAYPMNELTSTYDNYWLVYLMDSMDLELLLLWRKLFKMRGEDRYYASLIQEDARVADPFRNYGFIVLDSFLIFGAVLMLTMAFLSCFSKKINTGFTGYKSFLTLLLKYATLFYGLFWVATILFKVGASELFTVYGSVLRIVFILAVLWQLTWFGPAQKNVFLMFNSLILLLGMLVITGIPIQSVSGVDHFSAWNLWSEYLLFGGLWIVLSVIYLQLQRRRSRALRSSIR